MSAGDDMINAAALLAAERDAHEKTRVELARVTSDCEAKTARLRNAEACFEGLLTDVTAALDAMDVPECGTVIARLDWLCRHVWQGKGVSA